MNSHADDSLDLQLRRIAIVGRPNVGKSTLLNRFVGSRVAIVEPTAGVTRDRVAVPGRIPTSDGDRWFEFIDTGGIGVVDRDDLGMEVEAQVGAAVHAADLILFLVDVKDGVTPLDKEVARRLRGVPVPVLLCVNKCEGRSAAWGIDEFRQLGVGREVLGISGQNGEGLRDLYDLIGATLPPLENPESEQPPVPHMKLAVVGCRNAGKSTFVNALCQEQRMITSEIPGTTRDAVDVRFERDGKTFVVIDTAGVRKKQKMADAIEFFSDARSHRTVRRADVVLLMFDVSQELSNLDKALSRYVIDHYKPLILCANKWDLVSDMERQEFIDYIRDELPQLSYAPIRFLAAKDGHGVEAILKLAEHLYERCHTKISTAALNKALKRANEERSPTRTGANVKIYYATQTTVAPPTFTVFVNDKRFLNKHYVRYLTNRLRDELELNELPIRLELRDKLEDQTE